MIMENIKIKLEDLSFYYGDNQALKNISMNIATKEITAFIGPSGCGKSTCLKTINRMNDLIELLFEYVKIDSEGFKLEKEEYDLIELLRENAALMYTDIEDAQMEFVIDIPEERQIVEVDKLQFSRVITNLLVNAIRHNDENTIIKLSLKKYPGLVIIDIADNGGEISKDIQENIFEPFARGDKSRNSKGGTGLGLSIAQKIINMHGWEINLNTNYPEYTKAFEIKIPIS